MKRMLSSLLAACLLLAACAGEQGNGGTGSGMESGSSSGNTAPAAQPAQPPTEPARSAAPEPEPIGETLPPDKSAVFLQRDTDGTDDGVARLIASMEANGMPFYATEEQPGGLIGPEDVVLLKINCQWAERGGTNTDLLESVARAVLAHPEGFAGELVVADNGQTQYGTDGDGGSLDWERTNSADQSLSARDVVDRLKAEGARISGSLWDDFTMTRVGEYRDGDAADGFVVEDAVRSTGAEISYPKFTTEYGTRVSFREGIWDGESYDADALKIINLPVLKVHAIYGVTGAVKAYMGVVANRITGHRAHNGVGAGFMGTQMAHTRMPVLNILDMIWVGVRGGPGVGYGDAVECGMIAASTDPVALDYWAAKQVLIPAVEEASARPAGAQDPDGAEPGTFGYWLKLSAAELEAAGIPARMGDDAILLIE